LNSQKIKLKTCLPSRTNKKAHDKVQTGADFPNYIQDLIDLGVEDDTLLTTGMLLIMTL
jgi:hypothetical protein